MDVMSLTAGASGGDSITLSAESELGRFDRSANLRYTDTMLRKRDADDKFFEFLKDIEGVKISWGKRTSDQLAGSSGGRDDTNIKIQDSECNISRYDVIRAMGSWKRREFKYGDADCCSFIAHVTSELTGRDYRQFITYASEAEAYGIIDLTAALSR
jgi:hypothetical protein